MNRFTWTEFTIGLLPYAALVALAGGGLLVLRLTGRRRTVCGREPVGVDERKAQAGYDLAFRQITRRVGVWRRLWWSLLGLRLPRRRVVFPVAPVRRRTWGRFR